MSLPDKEDGSPLQTPQAAIKRVTSLKLATPSSCASVAYKYVMTPTTPDPSRTGFRWVDEDIHVIFFDFDGTLTETPGEAVTHHSEKKAQLKERAGMLAPRLQALRNARMTLGIISKSTENTIREALQDAGLDELFDGPVLGKAVGFEGKAGFIRDLCESGELGLDAEDGMRCTLLIDDDVRELERAKQAGIQTFAAPQTGGLQEADFDELFANLGLAPQPAEPLRAMPAWPPAMLRRPAGES